MRAAAVTVVVVLGGVLGAGEDAGCDPVPSVKAAGNRLEDPLLKGLDDDLFGAKDAQPGAGSGANSTDKPAPAPTTAGPRPGASVGESTSPEPQRVPAPDAGQPGPSAGEESGFASRNDVLRQIERQMRSAQARMSQPAAYAEIFQLHDDIVRTLQTLIDGPPPGRGPRRLGGGQPGQDGPMTSPPGARQAEPGPAGGQDPTRQPSGRAGGETTVAEGSTVVGELLGEVWGHLPERARERVMQWSNEQFLPKYEVQIERYFQRLAEPVPGEGQ